MSYARELENLISDELLPVYIIGCRSIGKDPKVNPILKKLLEAQLQQKPVPYLLRPKHEQKSTK